LSPGCTRLNSPFNSRNPTAKLEALFVEAMLFECLTQHLPSEEMGELRRFAGDVKKVLSSSNRERILPG
jgi:hypothetical protein